MCQFNIGLPLVDPDITISLPDRTFHIRFKLREQPVKYRFWCFRNRDTLRHGSAR
jgi:hypothetical protein